MMPASYSEWYNNEYQDMIDDIDESCKTKRDKKELREDKPLTHSQYKDLIAKHFDYTWDFDFLDIVANILDGVDDLSDYEAIEEAIDSEIIMDADQWTVLKHYCTASDANWERAYDELSADIHNLVDEILENADDEDDDTDESLKESIEIDSYSYDIDDDGKLTIYIHSNGMERTAATLEDCGEMTDREIRELIEDTLDELNITIKESCNRRK